MFTNISKVHPQYKGSLIVEKKKFTCNSRIPIRETKHLSTDTDSSTAAKKLLSIFLSLPAAIAADAIKGLIYLYIYILCKLTLKFQCLSFKTDLNRKFKFLGHLSWQVVEVKCICAPQEVRNQGTQDFMMHACIITHIIFFSQIRKLNFDSCWCFDLFHYPNFFIHQNVRTNLIYMWVQFKLKHLVISCQKNR